MTTRTAFVTGAARGIGRACALALAKAGARVACADLDAAGVEESARLVRDAGGESYACRIDISSAESIIESFA